MYIISAYPCYSIRFTKNYVLFFKITILICLTFLKINTCYAEQTTVFYIPETVDKALYEFAQLYAYTYVYKVVGYSPFWLTLTTSLLVGGCVLVSTMLAIELFSLDGTNRAECHLFYLFFWYRYYKMEIEEKNIYAMRVAGVSIQIYEKLLLEISKLDDDAQKIIFEEIFCVYRSYSFTKEQKMYLILAIVENIL